MPFRRKSAGSQSWNGLVNLMGSGLRYREIALDRCELACSVKDGDVEVESLDLVTPGERVEATAVMALDETLFDKPIDWKELEIAGQVVVAAAHLGDAVSPFNPEVGKKLGGAVDADLQWALADGKLTRLNGPVEIRHFRFEQLSIAKASLRGDSSAPNVIKAEGVIEVDDQNRIAAEGTYGIDTGGWAGEVELMAPDLAGLVRSTAGNGESGLSGRATIRASGSGSAVKSRTTGSRVHSD